MIPYGRNDRFVHAQSLERFFRAGSKSGIQSVHAARLTLILSLLDVAKSADDMNVPGFGLHPLKGDAKGYFAVKVSGNWRLIFKLTGDDIELVDYLDYH